MPVHEKTGAFHSFLDHQVDAGNINFPDGLPLRQDGRKRPGRCRPCISGGGVANRQLAASFWAAREMEARMIDKRKALPLHYQVLDSLRQRLKSGEWSQGELFPPDRHWVESFKVSLVTVRHALNALAQEGWLVRRPGKGTFVQTRTAASAMGAMTDIFNEMRAQGHAPSARLLRNEKCELGEAQLARYPLLRRFASITLFLIELVLRRDGKPVCLIESYWPFEIGREIIRYDLADQSVHAVLDALGIIRDSGEQLIRAEAASSRAAAHLDLPAGAPLLAMERLFFSGERAVEFSVCRYKADAYAYATRMDSQRLLTGHGVLLC